MAWDPTKPAEGAALESAKVRDNFAAIDAAIFARPLAVMSLPLEAARFPDGTAGNLFPQPTERVSTGTPASGVPKLLELVYAFDATVVEWLIFKLRVPNGYVSPAAATALVRWSMASAITGNIRIQAALGTTLDDSGDVRANITAAVVVSPDLAVPGTLGMQKETRLGLTLPTGLAAGQKGFLALALYAGGASSAAGDRILESLAVEWAR